MHGKAKSLLYVFIDESGNTGDIVINEKESLNFQQPYFVLGGFGVCNTKERLTHILELVQTLKKENNIHASELKGAHLWKKKKFKFIYELIDDLYINKYPIFVELIDKKYFVVISINNALIGPNLEIAEESSARELTNLLADYLYLSLSDETIKIFTQASRSPSPENVRKFLTAVYEDSKRFKKQPILGEWSDIIIKLAKDIIDRNIKEYKALVQEYNADPNAFDVPPWELYVSPPDPAGIPKRISLLPHTTSAISIFSRVNKYIKDKSIRKVLFIHDEQKQFRSTLKSELLTLLDSQNEVTKKLRELNLAAPLDNQFDYKFDDDFKIVFGDSKKTVFLQIPDIISSSLNNMWREFKFGGKYRFKKYSKDIILTYFDYFEYVHRSTGINFVVPTFEYLKLVEFLELDIRY